MANKESNFTSLPYKELGDSLKELLGEKNTSQWLANNTDVTRTASHLWVSGKARPTPRKLGHIAALLNCHADQVFTLLEQAGYDEEWDEAVNSYQMWTNLYAILRIVSEDNDISNLISQKYPDISLARIQMLSISFDDTPDGSSLTADS